MLTNQLIELFRKLKLPLNQIYDENGKLTKVSSIILVFFGISLGYQTIKIMKETDFINKLKKLTRS